jgi:hypothetical protein
MTRMLFWNIEQFSPNRFYSADNANDPDANLTKQAAAVARKDLLYRVIEAANPDVLVIVEVNVTKLPNSQLAQKTEAMIQLLTWLRGGAGVAVQSAEWRLVPPYWLAGSGGQGQESVAVFYRGQTGTVARFFTGPDVWPGGLTAPVLPTNNVATGPYGTSNIRNQPIVDYNAMLVPPAQAARNIPAGALHNAGRAENVVAARFRLRTNNGGAPGANANFGTFRPPLMVTLTEQAANGDLRDITIFGVHGPARDNLSRQFITTLAATFEVSSDLGGRETRIIGGDFNSNLLAADGRQTTAYDPLTNHLGGYQLLLRPPAGVPPVDLTAYKGYFGTHVQKISGLDMNQLRPTKFLWSGGVTDRSLYPGYGYLSANFFSLDNVLIRPLDAARNYQTTIMNTVVSSPLNAVNPVPGGAPTGSLAIAAEMPNVPVSSQPWPPAPYAANFTKPNATTLLEWDRYGHIVSTSDHFALFADV